VPLTDGTRASAGDLVVTRRNDRTLRLGPTDWVKNGDRWRITHVHPDGSVDARHLQLRRTLHLPADYAGQHVQLGYATTIHAAQGLTVDTSHTVLTGSEDRALAYVALSRGRARNDLYLATATDGDPHRALHPDAVLPPTALEQLARVLDRDDAPASAHTTHRDIDDPARQLADAVARYDDAVRFAAEQVLGGAPADHLTDQAHQVYPGLPDEPAWPTLRAHLALHALDGADPAALLRQVFDQASLHDARDPAAVLDHRLPAIPSGPLPWLPRIPAALCDDPDWGPYLQERAARVRDLSATVARDTHAWTPASAPAWARHLTHPADAQLRSDLAVWRAAFAVPPSDPRPTGPHQAGAAREPHQRRLHRAARALAPTNPHRARWTPTLPDPVMADPWSPALLRRLDRLDRAGLDLPGLLTQALAGRPLPDECPASALWWRLVPHLGPAATSAEDHPDRHLRPPWLPDLRALLGEDRTAEVQDAPSWPALVAAVDASEHDPHLHDRLGWTPPALIREALISLPDSLPAADLCDALVLRVAVLTDPPDDPEELPPDPLTVADGPPDPGSEAPVSLAPDTAGPRPGRPAVPTPDRGHPLTSRARINELHRAAAEFFTAQLPRSWAPAYLARRLGADCAGALTHHAEAAGSGSAFTVGYAPPGPTTLTRRLTAAGATLEELLDAGLARRRERGDIVDVFRDRLTFLIRDPDGHPVGFVGRRNPTKCDADFAGPKYLNTRATAAFDKGQSLFGLAEARAPLTAGASPVLVEGPLDALAVTLATAGEAVGLAPLGTALTADQADLLVAGTRDHPRPVVVATDADAAGWAAARVAYWRLTHLGAQPGHLALPAGTDPAAVLQRQGPPGIRSLLADQQPLRDAMLNRAIADLDNPAHRLARGEFIRRAAQIIASGPPLEWPPTVDRLRHQADLAPGILQHAVIEQNELRAADQTGYTERRITETRASQPRGPRPIPVLPVPSGPGVHRQGPHPTSPSASAIDRGPGGPRR
jgi:DNA primase catalytic core